MSDTPEPASPPKPAGQRSLLLRTVAACEGVPFSSTEDQPDFFNQYVHPAPKMRSAHWHFFCFSVGALLLECYHDGTPVQILFWKSAGCERRPLRLPPVDSERRAVFVLGEHAAPPPPLWDPMQQRLLYDPEARRARLQLIETMETRCVLLAKQALVELTAEDELAALWMLEVGDAGPDANQQAMQAVHRQRIPRR